MALQNQYNYKRPVGVRTVKKKQTVVMPQVKKTQQELYLEQKIMAAKPEELTLMLYEGLIKFIKLAQMFVKEKNIPKVHENTMRAQDIVLELRSTLNMDYDVAKNLDSLYEFIENRLVEGNMLKQEKPYSEALTISEELYDTWKEAMTLV